MHRYPGTPVSPHVRLSVPRLAYASRSWCTRASFCRTGAAGVSPPWFGWCNATAFRFAPRVVSRTTAGLRQPLLGARAQVVANGRWCFATAFRFPRNVSPPWLCCNAHVLRSDQRFLRCANDRPTDVANVSPPWRSLVAAMRTSAGEKRFLRCTNAGPTKSGAYAPRSWLRVRASLQMWANRRREPSLVFPRLAYAPRSCAAMRTSAGEKRFLRCTNAHPTKSGGRQPAVGCIAPRGQCTANNVGRVTTVQSRAAGVSPPWFDKHVYADTSAIARKTVESMCADHRCHCVQRYHGGLTPPALVLQCERLRRKTIFAMHKRTSDQERRASARRGSDSRLQRRPAFSDRIRLARTCGCTPAAPGCTRASRPKGGGALQRRFVSHGGLTPPALVLRCEKKAIFAMHKRTFSRAAGVSPPWISNSGAIVNVYHGGLTPTAPGCATCVRRAKAPFAMHKRTFSRAASVRSSCAVLRAVTRATDGVPDRKAVIERASRPG
jgi:hypothetical protein